jgi:hypothetical protein
LDYARGPEKTWVYGGLRIAEGPEGTMTAPARHSGNYQRLVPLVEDADSTGDLWIVTDNLSRHDSAATRTWLVDHPRIGHAFLPTRACWLDMAEGWWRLLRKAALAGPSCADPEEITLVTRAATVWLNSRARSWVWGRPALPTRTFRRRFVYIL